MPAQPLSSVNPTAAVYHQPSPFDKAPHLVVQIARVIALGAEIEAHTGTLLVMMLGASAPPAAAMYQSLTSSGATAAAIEAAAETVLSKDEFAIFGIVRHFTQTVLKVRNLFCHATWGWSPDIPDAALFIEQSARMTLNLEIERSVRENLPKTGIKFDPRYIWVYDERAIQEAIKQTERALALTVLLRLMVSSHSRGRGLKYSTLLSQPEIAEALAHLRERQKNNPSARPRSHRRRGPRK